MVLDNRKNKFLKEKEIKQTRKLVMFQLLILIVSIFAISWLIAGNLDAVSADGPDAVVAECTKKNVDWKVCALGQVCKDEIGTSILGPDKKNYPCCKECVTTQTTTTTTTTKEKLPNGSPCTKFEDCISNFCAKSTGSNVKFCRDVPPTIAEDSTQIGPDYSDDGDDTDWLTTGSSLLGTVSTVKGLFSSSAVSGTTSTTTGGLTGTIGASTATETAAGASPFLGAIGAIIGAFVAAYGYAYVVKLLGASERNVNALTDTALYIASAVAAVTIVLASITTTAGATAGTSISLLASMLGFAGGLSATGVGIVAAVVVVVAMSVYLLASYQDYSQEIYTYTSHLWQPPKGGENCLKCNDLRYGCSEYQCHASGKSCDIVNKGTSEEACVWVNENDMLPPELTAIKEVLGTGYSYIPAEATLPDERGVKIIYNANADGCIPPFSSLLLGVHSNEPAACKIDTVRKANFTDMLGYMSEGTASVYNHTVFLPSSAMPSNSSLGDVGLSISEDNEYTFYIRCEDTNGNPTTSNFLMQFCVDNGPDTMAPIIESTSYPQNGLISFNKTTIPLEVYINEPADCRWDFQDLDYSKMNFNMTDCSQKAGDYLKQYYYGCKTDLTGIQNEKINKYYIRCNDQPWLENLPEKKHLRNENKQSYVLSLTGTPPLIIDEILINDKPNGALIKDATDTIKTIIKIKTLAGAEEGKAKCAYQINNEYIYFYNQGVPEFILENTQEFWLTQGNYNYSIRCEDRGGNTVYDNAFFTVERDTDAPEISRVYKEDLNLKLITSEPAECVYSAVGCSYEFEDGSLLNSLEDGLTHFVAWDTKTNYYIKCKDKYGNYPVPQDQCSIVARGSEYFS